MGERRILRVFCALAGCLRSVGRAGAHFMLLHCSHAGACGLPCRKRLRLRLPDLGPRSGRQASRGALTAATPACADHQPLWHRGQQGCCRLHCVWPRRQQRAQGGQRQRDRDRRWAAAGGPLGRCGGAPRTSRRSTHLRSKQPRGGSGHEWDAAIVWLACAASAAGRRWWPCREEVRACGNKVYGSLVWSEHATLTHNLQ